MSSFKDCIIPISGLSFGIHQYKIEVDSRLFKAVESEEIQEGNFTLELIIDKKPKTIIAHIAINGSFSTTCDRCLAQIQLPISGEQVYTFKYSEEEEADQLDEETVVLDRHVTEIDFAPYVYETICLSIPIIRTYNCANDENANCDENTLKYLEQEQQDEVKENPVWDILKNIN